MELLNDILDKIMDTAQENLCEKAKQLIDQKQLKNKLNDMENNLDDFLLKNYQDEVYYDSLDKYIHSGKISQDKDSDDTVSAFYYTLLCAFLNSDSNFLGETNFLNYHWKHIQEYSKTNVQYDESSIKKCFLYYYNTFKEEFGCPSDTNRSAVNALIETDNENRDALTKRIADESNLIRESINEGFEKFLEQNSMQKDNQPLESEEICDDNTEYQERLQDPLFLESEIDDGKKVSLASFHSEPHIKFNYKSLKQWVENRDSRLLLLYGKAGIGKTSYTSWLSLNKDFSQECHILELRKCIRILDNKNPWESIKKSFKCMNDDKYQNKVLILDGLDEVCVLKSDFDGQEFIYNLNSTLKTGIGRTIRIIITSRMGYFNEVKITNNVNVATIYWDEDSIGNWCNEYCKIHSNRSDWCESFKKTYADLETRDKRKEIFCTPLILYICCVSQVDISKHNSVASIYDEAFNVIGTRRYNELTEASKEEFEVNRQFTKELAFQMFLNDKLEDILGSNFVQIAKEKVVRLARGEWPYQIKELEFKKLFAINHFAYGKNNAIEFAHKTIGEYFTAVKLYEDYFEQIDETVESMWRNVFNAFRCKSIPPDILQYLVDLILNKQDDNWKESFFKAYYEGIENQSLSVAAVACFNPEYSTTSVALMNQMKIAFRNLTWLLTGLGFDNNQFTNTNDNLQILATFFYGDVNVCGWKNLGNINFEGAFLENINFSSTFLKRANFERANLKGANFQGADLEEVRFKGAYLEGANFEGAHLEGAHFEGANLTISCLEGAYLEGAHLEGAHLTRSDFIKAKLQGAYLDILPLN